MEHSSSRGPRGGFREAFGLVVLAGVVLATGMAMAQTVTPEQARRKLAAAGYTESDVRRLLAAERPANAPAVKDSARVEPLPTTPPQTLPAPPVEAAPSQAAPPGRADSASVDLHAPQRTAELQPFGVEIFGGPASTFEPLTYGPVDSDYPIGPGDELMLTLWGDNQLSLALTVNREGYVVVPDAGQVLVNGLSLEAARARLRSTLARFYSGLRPEGRGATTFLDVSLGRLRAIQVFLLGEVARPGGYTVSSVSRVLNALYAAGGPTSRGSMRDVRVMRGGQSVASVDLYDLVLRGSTTGEVRLQNGDVVFVPVAGRRVALIGEVRRPALFELRANEHLRALVGLAGGVRPTTDLARAQVERIVPAAARASRPGQDRMAVDVALGGVLAGGAADVPLEDGDRVTFYAIRGDRTNTVALTGGGVYKPGVYERRPGMRLRDLIEQAGGLTPDAFQDRARITRTGADRVRSQHDVQLALAMSGDSTHNLPLEPLDEVAVLTVWDLKERQQVTLRGEVREPGEYELLENMTLADLLLKAGGLLDAAYARRAEIVRVAGHRKNGLSTADTLLVSIDRDFARSSGALGTRLLPRDAVFIRRDPEFVEQAFVVVEGEVRFPGVYGLTRRDERIADLVRRAGGLTELAYASGASFERDRVGLQRLAIDLPAALKDLKGRNNLVLEPGDVLRVPRYSPTVTIEGAVRNPVTALYQPGRSLGYYITQASGYRRDADRRGTVVVMANGDVRRGGAPDPGSKIVVPARPEEEGGKDRLKDLSAVFGILASAITTVYLVQQASK